MSRIIQYALALVCFCIFFILFLYLTGVVSAPELPEAEISRMQNAISLARNSGAAEYAEKDFALCLQYFDSAMVEWKQQNEKWIRLRDYSRLEKIVRLTTEIAGAAKLKAVKARGSLKDYVDYNMLELLQRDSVFRTQYKYLPLSSHVFREHSRAHLNLLEAVGLQKRGNLSASFNKLVEAENGFLYVESEAGKLLRSYFTSFDQWDKWITQTIKNSRLRKSSAIIVDKVAHKCFLYKNGVLIRTYDAEFSPKWIGDKNHQGDDATPEGLYFITKKLDSRHTKYHKALLINYPNERDKKRYEEAIRSGAIPGSVSIGNLIEIHGDGGKGKDWTNGCIALANEDIDQLFPMVSVGVPVTIVGSTVPLNQLFTD